MVSFNNREQLKRSEGNRQNQTNQLLYSGMGSFGAKRSVADERAAFRKEVALQASQLAKIRFNIGVEKAKRVELEKTLEEQQVAEIRNRAIDDAAAKRKKELGSATKLNLRMTVEREDKFKMDRTNEIEEGKIVQTSLKPKKVEDAQETYKMNQRKALMVEANKTNFIQNKNSTALEWNNRSLKLQAEQQWLNDLKEANDTEQNFLNTQKKQLALDLRETYKEQ